MLVLAANLIVSAISTCAFADTAFLGVTYADSSLLMKLSAWGGKGEIQPLKLRMWNIDLRQDSATKRTS